MKVFSGRKPASAFSKGGLLNRAQDTGVGPPGGYIFLLGKSSDGSYSILSGLNTNGSRSNLVGKAS